MLSSAGPIKAKLPHDTEGVEAICEKLKGFKREDLSRHISALLKEPKVRHRSITRQSYLIRHVVNSIGKKKSIGLLTKTLDTLNNGGMQN